MRTLFAISAALALIAAPLPVDAQVGVKSGLSFGNVSNTGALPEELGVRTGFTIGVSAFTPGALALGVEGLYSQRGVSSQAGFQSRELEYLDLPLLLRLSIPAGVSPYAYAGPQLSFELACNSGGGDCPRGDRPKSPQAAVIGAGVAFGVGPRVSIEGRYIYGLRDLDFETVTDGESFKERSFIILAGVTF